MANARPRRDSRLQQQDRASPENTFSSLSSKMNIGLNVLQIAAIIVGGIWVLASVSGKVDGVVNDLTKFEAGVTKGFEQVFSIQRENVNQVNSRIDQLIIQKSTKK